MTRKAPTGLKAAGRRLWDAVVGAFELDEHELALLVQAAHTADLCAELQAIVDRQGLVAEKSRRVHPAAVELRNQRILLARLVVALRVPLGDDERPTKTGAPRLQRRPVRGMYSITGGLGS